MSVINPQGLAREICAPKAFADVKQGAVLSVVVCLERSRFDFPPDFFSMYMHHLILQAFIVPVSTKPARFTTSLADVKICASDKKDEVGQLDPPTGKSNVF